MRPFASFTRNFASPRGAHLLFILLTTLGLLSFASSPELKRRLGLNQHDLWFADTYAVLAASDAHRAGIDPTVVNPLDILDRAHGYSDWWYGLAHLGLTRDHNFLVGASWVLSFLVVAWLTLRPADPAAAARFAVLVLSPPVLFAVNRANNDLLIFAFLGVATLVLRPGKTWSWLPALALIALSTGLKFYPVVAAIIFLLLRPSRRLVLVAATAALVLGVVLLTVWSTLARGQFALPATLYTFGAPTLLRDLGYAGTHTLLIAGAFLALCAAALNRARLTVGLADDSIDFHTRALFLLGATTLLACFLAGVSYSYRWIFALWLAPWLLDHARNVSLAPPRRRLAALTGWLLLALSWLDGLFCLATNTLLGPSAQSLVHELQWAWRFLTQPLAWLFFALLAGWIADAVWCALRTLRPSGGNTAARASTSRQTA
jgi:hypothetical protein